LKISNLIWFAIIPPGPVAKDLFLPICCVVTENLFFINCMYRFRFLMRGPETHTRLPRDQAKAKEIIAILLRYFIYFLVNSIYDFYNTRK